MWGRALRVIPRLSKSEWDGLDVVSRWLVATRSAVLIMTFISAAIAGLLALRAGKFHLMSWLLMTLGLLMAHALNNLLNDLTDYRRGVDHGNYFRTQYGPQPLEQGLMSVRELLGYAAVTAIIALAAGAYLVWLRGPLALLLLALGTFFVLFYTWPLKYVGLGELTVLLVWGPLMVGGGYFVVTGEWSWQVALASLVYALGPTTVIFGKHIDKFVADRAKGIHTVPVLLGETAARYTVLGMMIAQYLLVIYLVAIGFFSPVMLVTLLGLTAMPLVWAMYRAPKPAERPADYPADTWPLWFVAVAFLHNRRFGLWFLLGLLVDVVLHALRIF
jgi:1,4-dihydroxy-2-naphthoate octaprenyltransferase